MNASAGRLAAVDPSGVADRDAITITDLSVCFPGARGPVQALTNISVGVARGSILALVGRSGSGKSTLLRVIGGLIAPTKGNAAIGDTPITGPHPTVRVVAQDYTQSLLPWKTVVGNVEFGARHAASDRRDPSLAVDAVIEAVGLSHARDRFPRQLSGGMQQRVAIARALASQAGILLMDEPFGSVDALSRASLQDLILRLWSRFGFTLILVTHDIDEALYLSDRVLVLDHAGKGFAADLTIDLPRPRHQVETREHPAYLDYRRTLLEKVLEQPAPAGGIPR